jgi:hypothetical protein
MGYYRSMGIGQDGQGRGVGQSKYQYVWISYMVELKAWLRSSGVDTGRSGRPGSERHAHGTSAFNTIPAIQIKRFQFQGGRTSAE